ncbi:unnamed protein product [Lampetra planeri]
MQGCGALVCSAFEYKTEKLMIARDRSVGVVYRLIQLVILAYIIGWVFVVKKGYQETDPDPETSVITKVKGVALTNSTEGPGQRLWDTADYVIPPQGESRFFVITNLVSTPRQRQGLCAENPNVPGARCQEDGDCPAGRTFNTGNGVCTGRCVPTNGTARVCEVHAWCPVENSPTPREAVLREAENFTVFIKVSVNFTRFNVHRRNVLEEGDSSYLKSCEFHPERSPLCPVFRLGELAVRAGASFSDMATRGGVIAVHLAWDCDLDRDLSACAAQYRFSRLDSERSRVAAGHNFRFARYSWQDGAETRSLFKVYGVRFDVMVSGKAGKFSIVPTLLNLGAGLALLGAGSFLCDLFLLYASKESPQYRQRKFERSEEDGPVPPQQGAVRARSSSATGTANSS